MNDNFSDAISSCRGVKNRQREKNRVISLSLLLTLIRDALSPSPTLTQVKKKQERFNVIQQISTQLPLSALLLPLFTSVAIMSLPATSPSQPSIYMSETRMFDFFTSGGNSSRQLGTSKLVVLFTLFLPPFVLLILRLCRKRTQLGILLVTSVTSIICYQFLYSFLLDARSSILDEKRFCVLSSSESTAVVNSLLLEEGYKETKSCEHANMIFTPVPWLDRSLIDGTIFGGVPRSSRLNQIPFAETKYTLKQSLHDFMMNDDEFEGNSYVAYYPFSMLTGRNERLISKANKRANSTFPWIVKAVEGGAKKIALSHSNSSIAIGNKPYYLIGKLANRDVSAERRTALNLERRKADGLEDDTDATNSNSRKEQQQSEKQQATAKDLRRSLWKSKEKKKNASLGYNDDNDNTTSYLVQRYVSNPLLIEKKKWTMEVPVLITSLNPLRVYIHEDLSAMLYACEEYKMDKDEDGKPNMPNYLDEGLLLSHNTKARDDCKIESVRDSDFFQRRGASYQRNLFEKVRGIAVDVILRGVENWRKDLRIARDFRLHLGSRPTGSGGTFDRGKARDYVVKQAAKQAPLDEKKRSDYSIDESDVLGGGFHLLLFEVLVDEGGTVWLIDVDGTPVYGDEGREKRVVEKEQLYRDVLRLAGWIGKDQDDDDDDDVDDVGMCGEADEERAGICKLRSREATLERKRAPKTDFKQIIPSKEICDWSEDFVNAGYFTALDIWNCEVEKRLSLSAS